MTTSRLLSYGSAEPECRPCIVVNALPPTVTWPGIVIISAGALRPGSDAGQDPCCNLNACCVSGLVGPNTTLFPAWRAAVCCLSNSVPGVA